MLHVTHGCFLIENIGLTSHRLPTILEGDLDEFIDAMATQEQAENLQAVEA